MKMVTSKDSPDTIARHNASASHRDIPPRKKPMPNMGNHPKLPPEVIAAVPEPDPAMLATRPKLEQWSRYDRGLWAGIEYPDGTKSEGVEQIDGLIVKLQLKGPGPTWVYMDTGDYYRLGNRRYAGT